MRKLLLVFLLALSGCSIIMPIPHDGAMFNNLVVVKMSVDGLDCNNKDTSWDVAIHNIQHLKIYAIYRNDPQAKSITELEDAVVKAKTTQNVKFCESILKINKTRIDVVADAWRGR